VGTRLPSGAYKVNGFGATVLDMVLGTAAAKPNL